ncbi:MAG: hypothetical protein M5U26_10750 [Planctomycetota bacterium]|nr:hypothetical protein [Planctomycetota bacterium]
MPVRSPWAPLLTLALVLSARSEEEPALERVVEFRDGTVLKMRFEDHELAFKPVTDAAPGLKLSGLERLVLARNPRVNDLRRVAERVAQLGSDDFGAREKATEELRALGAPVKKDLEDALARAEDPETKMRLRRILAELPLGPADPGEGLADELRLAGGRVLLGDLGEWALVGRVDGTPLVLERAQVLSLGAAAPMAVQPAAEAESGHAARIETDEDAAFGPQATRIDFEKAPDGAPLQPGQDIRRTFVGKGFTLATSFDNAIVSVNTYNVDGRSKGLSCATHQPLWQGQLTIRFHVPGHPEVPAGVTRAGLWIAAVSKDGTALEAYDALDRPILTVKTVKSPNDFLALRSPIPIAKLKVVPNPAIDQDYTIDDLTFDPPRPLGETGHATRQAVRFDSGERVFAGRIALNDGRCLAEALTVGLERLERPAGQVREIAAPYEQWKPVELPPGCWLKLKDGSVLRGRSEDGLRLWRDPKVKPAAEELAALWSDKAAYAEPKTEDGANELPPAGGVSVLKPDGAEKHARWSIGFEGLELAGQGAADGQVLKYLEAPMLWVAPVPKPPEAAGLVRLTSGETLVLAPPGQPGFALESWTEEAVVIVRGALRLELKPADVIMARLPKARKQ